MAEEFKVRVGMLLDEGASTNLKSQIESITSKKYNIKFDFTDATSQINKLKSELTSLGNIKIKVGGTGISSTASTNGIKNTVKDMQWAYNQMLSIQKNIGSLRIKINGLDTQKNNAEITELKSQLKELEATYRTIQNTFNMNNLSVDQWGKLQTVIETTENKLKQLDAKVIDTKNKLVTTINSNISSGQFSKEIQSVESRLQKLSSESTYIKGLNQDLILLKQSYAQLQIAQTSSNPDKLITANQKYDEILKRVNNTLTEAIKLQEMNSQVAKLQNDKTILSNQMDVWLKNNSAAARQFGSQIKALQVELKNCDATRFSGIKSEFQAITQQAQLADKATMTFGGRLKKQLSEYTTYFTGAMLITQVIRGLKSMYDNVVEIDTAMTELKKVTNETNESYNNFLTNSADKAQKIGTTIKDYVSSTADFARLGYNFKDSQYLAEVANIYKVVGDDIDSIETATESIISTLAAFNIEASDSISIVDKLNEVGNNYAISSGGIGEALKRSASSMAAANNTLDETIALITAANTVVQNPESVGTAFKTISMRIRGATTELEEAGLDTEGMAESTAKLRNEIMALSGIDIMLNENTFKSTYQIMDELSQKWEELTDIQQASITELIAGKRQGNIVSSLMSNFDIARNALQTSENSKGSAEKEHEKWMQSLEAKINKLKATWESFSQSFLKSDFLSGLISGLTNVVDLFDKLVNNIGTLPTLFATIAGVMSFSNKGMFTVQNGSMNIFGQSIGSFLGNLNKIPTAIQRYNDSFSKSTSFQVAYNNALNKSNSSLATYFKNLNGGKASILGYGVHLVGATAKTIALQAATMALNMALSMGIAAIISGIVTALGNFIHAAKNAADAANELAESQKQSLDEQIEEQQQLIDLIEQYQQLKVKENLDTSTRSQIKNIQKQITDLVGEQAKNLDLVNGKLDDEIAKLNTITAKEAKDTVTTAVASYTASKNANKKAIGDSKDSALFGLLNYDDYDFSDTVSDSDYKIAEAIRTKLHDVGLFFYQDKMFRWSDWEITIQNLGESATERYNNLNKALEFIEKEFPNEYSDSVLYSQLYEQAKKYKETSDKQTDAANSLLNSVINSEYYNNNELKNINVNSVDSFNLYYEKMIETLENNNSLKSAIEDGYITNDLIKDYTLSFMSTLDGFSDFYNDWTKKYGSKDNINIFTDVIDNLINTGSTNEKKALNKLKNNSFMSAIIEAYDSEGEKLREIFENDGDMIGIPMAGAAKELFDAGYRDIEISVKEYDSKIQNLYNEALANIDFTDLFNNMFGTIDIANETKNIENFFSAIGESISSSGLSSDAIDNIKNMFSNLNGYDENTLFEHTANGIHLNTEELRKLQSQYKNYNKIATNNKLSALITTYNELTTQINECSDATEKANLISQRDEIKNQITSVSTLASQYEALTSAFYEWEQAQSTENEGSMYDSVYDKLSDIKELYEDGLIGTDDFKTAVQLMSNIDLSNADVDELLEAYEKGYPKMIKYFTEGSDGCIAFLKDIENLNSEWVHMNEDGSWEIDFGKGDDQKIADALGINVETVQSILRKLSDYGFEINLDSIYTSFDLLEADTNSAIDTLKKLDEEGFKRFKGKNFNFDFNLNSTDTNDIANQITEAQKIYDSYKKKDGTFAIKAKGYQEAETILIQLINKKQQLSAPAVMSVTVDDNAKTDIEKGVGYLQDLQTQYNNFEIQIAVGEDTTATQQEIQNIAKNINNLPDKVKTDLGINTEEFNTAISNIIGTDINLEAGVSLNQEDVNTVTTAISGITPEIMVNAGLDSTKIDGYDPTNKESTVTYIVNEEKVNDWEPPEKTGKITYKPTEDSGKITISYTSESDAKVDGTAFAKGNWGTKNSGIALGGELGQELIVRNGRFFTIGDDSAEFFKYQKGDIIFNAAQTKEILEKGKITSSKKRGNSYANGTAFIEGTAFSSGSGKIISNGKTTTTGKSKNNSNSNSKSKSNTDKNGKTLKDTLDWIEVAIERVETAIDNLDQKANSVYRSFASRNKQLGKEISKVRKEIDLQQKGMNRYDKQAAKVAKTTGLSKSWQKKVKNGKIDIDSISDSKKTSKGYNLKQAISDYQEWINKSNDCNTAIQKLKETVKEFYKTAFDNTVSKFDGKLAKFEHRANMINTSISKAESQGYAASTKYYTALLNNEKNNLSTLIKERGALQDALNTAVSEGKIKKGSEAYNEMQQKIWDVDEAIRQSEADTAEWNREIQQIKWDRFDALRDSVSKVTDESEFLIDLLSSKDLYTDNGQLTNEGLSTMGLHTQNYNTQMEQAIAYAKEREKIEKELAKNPYDTNLIDRKNELIELEQESILAAEDEKQAIIDMVQEGIEIELEALQELIDSYTDALDAQKDLYDYQKKVSSQTKEIASIQKQLSAYENDTSEEAKSKIQELKVSLTEAKDNLEETQYDQYITDQKNLLSDLYDEYEEILNQRLDNVDKLLKDMITTVNNNSSTINSTINTATNNVGYTLTNAMQSIWSSNRPTVTTYNNGMSSGSTSTQTAVSGVVSETKAVQNAADNNAKTENSNKNYSTKYSANTKKQVENIFNNSKYYTTGKKKKASDYKTEINQYLFGKSGKVLTSDGLKQMRNILGVENSGIKAALNEIKKYYGNIKNVKGFKTGVYNLNKNQLAWTQEGGNTEAIIRPSDGAILTPLAKYSSVLNANATANLWDIANNPEQFIKDLLDTSTANVPNVISTGNNDIENNVEVVITLPNVENYEQFVSQLQKDKHFEEMIQDMTINRLVGGSSLSKYRHRF